MAAVSLKEPTRRKQPGTKKEILQVKLFSIIE